MSGHSFALSVEMPDDEPRQIVCTGEEAGADIWQPAFGVWEADDFGIDADETVGDGERLYVSRRIYDAMNARLADAEAMAEALRGAEVTIQNLINVMGTPDQRQCCDGRECGCMGATVYQEAEYYAGKELKAVVAALEKWRAGK